MLELDEELYAQPIPISHPLWISQVVGYIARDRETRKWHVFFPSGYPYPFQTFDDVDEGIRHFLNSFVAQQ